MDKTINGLLIEDDPDDTLLLMELMAGQSWPAFTFAFTCAENLQSGLKLLHDGAFEVVLLDLMLPESRGIETVRRVRAQSPDIPIVVLTGLSDEKMGLEALASGAQDYQVKGNISGHALKRTISFAVERHRLTAGLRNTIENAPDGMVVIDGKGAIRYVNPAAERFFTPERLLPGKPFPHPLPASGQGEIKLAGDGGEERCAEIRLSDIQWGDQSAKLALIRDITELRRLEELRAEIRESRRMDKLKDELISSISHEMRSPLAIVKAAICNLRDGLAGPLLDQQTDMVRLAHRNVMRLERIVDNVLDLSRLESGRALIKTCSVDPGRLLRDALTGFELLANERQLSLELDIPAELPHVQADPELFVEVLDNLLSNAIRFSRAKVIVRARVAEAAQASSRPAPAGSGAAVLSGRRCLQLSVIDDGNGIPRERLGDLFNKFVQIDRRKSGGPRGGGAGLGLALCKEILNRQEGRIWVESEEGRGARFHFALPLA